VLAAIRLKIVLKGDKNENKHILTAFMVYCGGITSGSMFPFDTKFNDRLSEA
jgi:hypothetical protein